MKNTKKSKILFAAGGSGGHMFPAQGLALQLMRENPELEVLFAGTGLSENRYFDREKFAFRDIHSTTFFRGNPFTFVKLLMQGVRESLELFDENKTDLAIGFGSFHSFPVLFAATIRRIPFVLFASDSVPGKVIRLFSRKALFTAVFFEEAKSHLKGSVVEVDIPRRNARTRIHAKEARLKLGLKSDFPTLLVFGGSQGAQKINECIVQILPHLKKFQLVHLTGNEEMAEQIEKLCGTFDIPCYVKKFESDMNILWNAADLAICRSGAMTISEILDYEVPAILIPYPFAADRHQHKNAQIFQEKIGGGTCLDEGRFTPETLIKTIETMDTMQSKHAIQSYKARQKKEDLCHLITTVLN